MSDYVMIYNSTGRHIVLSSLKAIEEKLPDHRFVRSHRSFIVNLDKITAIDDSSVIINENSITVGKTFKLKFLQMVCAF